MIPPGFLAALAPGTVISGKYRVERPLGTGGMGVVVAARHLDLNQVFALKVLMPSAASSDEATTRFVREGRAAAQLTSPHIAKVHDTGRLLTGEPYLVMELLRGRDLRALLTEVGRVSLAQAVEWILQVAHALTEAHALNIIHRDVKPANLFLAETSLGQQIKVLDFGISKQLDSTELELTNTTSAVGTPRYMAPEQMRSARFADARGDVWSLGVVLYELTTGEYPFQGDSITALCFDVMERTPATPSQVNPELPTAFDEVIDLCLKKDPDERFQSMEALATALCSLIPDARSTALFRVASTQPADSVRGRTPMPAISTLDPASSAGGDGQPGPAGLSQLPMVTLQVGQPLFAELPPHETMRSWNTTAVPRPIPKTAARRLPLIALGIGIGIAIATLVMVFTLDREPAPLRTASSSAPSTVPTPSPSIAPVESVVVPIQPPELVRSTVPPEDLVSQEPVPSPEPPELEAPEPEGKLRTPPVGYCKDPFTKNEKGHKVPKKGCF